MGGSFNEKTLNLFKKFEINTTAFKREQSLSLLSNYKKILEKYNTTPVKEDLEHPLIGQEYRTFMFLSEYIDTLNNGCETLQNCIDDYKNVNETATKTRESLFEKGIRKADTESWSVNVGHPDNKYIIDKCMNCKSLDEFYELSKEIISYKDCAIKKHLYDTVCKFIGEYKCVKMIINMPFRELFKSKEKEYIIKCGNLYLENAKQSPDIQRQIKKVEDDYKNDLQKLIAPIHSNYEMKIEHNIDNPEEHKKLLDKARDDLIIGITEDCNNSRILSISIILSPFEVEKYRIISENLKTLNKDL